MIKWLSKKAQWIIDTLEEVDDLPWDSIIYSKKELPPEGIRFFELVAIYLRENNYYSRPQHQGSQLVVYRNWFRYIIHSPSFILEVGKTEKDPNVLQVWRWGKQSRYEERYYHAYRYDSFESGITDDVQSRYKPVRVCKISDPDCLERILDSIDDFFRS